MERNQINYLAIDVEVTTMSNKNGTAYLAFHPDNPFIRSNYQPLPYWNYSTFYNSHFNGELYWVIEEELIVEPGLDLKKAFNCFSQVPTQGARYSIKLCVDVPDNKNPMRLPPQSGSETGHSFIVVTKSNGDKTITQVFGFYAQKHPGFFFPWRAMPSVVKNNQLREINASIEMGLTQQQFELLRENAFELAKRKYEAASFNCTNYSLDLFNSVRTNQITINSYTAYLPTNQNIYGTSKPETLKIDKTPQMLFKKLAEMQKEKNNETSNIVIDQTGKTKSPFSHGECNQ